MVTHKASGLSAGSQRSPAGLDNNWVQATRGKDWLVILRLYGPLERWVQQDLTAWRDGLARSNPHGEVTCPAEPLRREGRPSIGTS